MTSFHSSHFWLSISFGSGAGMSSSGITRNLPSPRAVPGRLVGRQCGRPPVPSTAAVQHRVVCASRAEPWAVRMHEAFEASVVTLGTETVVSLRGELDVAEAPTLRSTLLGLVAAGHDTLVIDLSQLDLVASTGLSALVAARRVAAPTGGEVVLAN